MRVWLVTIGLGALLILGSVGLRAFGSPEIDGARPVARLPWNGDAAAWTSSTTTFDGNGAVKDTEVEEQPWQLRWNTTSFRLASGSAIDVAALELRFEVDPSTGEVTPRGPLLPVGIPALARTAGVSSRAASADPGGFDHVGFQMGFVYARLPGSPTALITLSTIHAAFTNRPWNLGPEESVEFAQQQTKYELWDQPCQGEPGALVAGLAPAAAEQVVTDCLQQVLVDEDLQPNVSWASRWENDDAWGRIWRYEMDLDAVDQAGNPATGHVALIFSPSVSVLVASSIESWGWDDGEPFHVLVSQELSGWEPGTEPVPVGGAAWPEPPTIALVPWGIDGPTSGDLGPFGLKEVRAAVAGTDDGKSFFADHPEALIADAQFQEIQAGLPESVLFGENGARQQWFVTWQGTGADFLGAVASEPKYARSHPLGTPLPVGSTAASRDHWSDTDSWGGEWPLPPATGPEPAALLGSLSLVDAVQEHGDGSIQVMSGAMAFDENRTAVPTEPLVGVVSRSWTQTDGSGRMHVNEAGIEFHEGRATATFVRHEASTSNRGPLPLSPLSRPPSSEPAPIAGLPPPALGLAGLALVTAGAAASPPIVRILPGLYTRLTSREILNNPSRARVLEAVRARPGTSALELAASLGIHQSSVKHHLRMLDKLGFVALTRTGRGLVAHPIGDPASLTARVMSRAHAPELVAAIRARPGRSVSELAAELGLRKSRVSVLVSELEEAAVVSRRRGGREVRLFAAASAPRERAP